MIADHNINWLTRLASRDAMVASRTYPVVKPEVFGAVTRLQYHYAPQQRHGGNGRILRDDLKWDRGNQGDRGQTDKLLTSDR